jgi:hypothetical protein
MTTYSDAIAATIAKAPAISPATRDRIIAILNPVGGAAR